MINCRKKLNDSYYVPLQPLLVSEPANLHIKVPKSCVSQYTSFTNVKAHVAHVHTISCVDDDNEQGAPKQL